MTRAAAAALMGLSLLPTNGRMAQIVSAGPPTRRTVALTFDAGADRGYAPRILNTLRRSHIHATFGMTGRWAVMNPDLVRRMAHDGDEIINHTYDHRSFTGYSTRLAPLSDRQRAWEITTTENIVRRLTGRSTKPFFRPPYGDYDARTLTLIRRLGYRYMVMWTTDTLGWDGLNATQIVARTLSLARPGDIILMHVGAQSQDALALPTVIAQLRRRGYRFVTVAQMVTGRD